MVYRSVVYVGMIHNVLMSRYLLIFLQDALPRSCFYPNMRSYILSDLHRGSSSTFLAMPGGSTALDVGGDSVCESHC